MAEQKRISSADGEFEVAYYEYAPEDEQSVVRTVVIFPPTGGITFLDKSYARKIKKRGARAIVLSHWTGKSEESLDLRLHHLPIPPLLQQGPSIMLSQCRLYENSYPDHRIAPGY